MTITSLVPLQLGLNGGADINITGKGFGNKQLKYVVSLDISSVLFKCNVRLWSANLIVCRAPELVDGLARVLVRFVFIIEAF